MVWDLDRLARNSGEDVVLSVVLAVDDLATHQRTHLGVSVHHLQLPAVLAHVVVQRDDVEGGAALVLLAQVEVVTFDINEVFLIVQMVLDFVESVMLSVKSFLAQLMYFFLVLVENNFSLFLIVFIEVFVEPISFMNKVGGYGIRSEYLSRINILVEAACPFLQPLFLEGLPVFDELDAAGVDRPMLHGVGTRLVRCGFRCQVWS